MLKVTPRAGGIFRKTVWIALLFLYGCTTAPVQSISKFKEGLSAVQTDSRAILLEHNRFVRELQLDRATSLSKITESDIAPGLDAASISRWNQAMEAMALYTSAIENLAAPTSPMKVEESLQSLGNRILALKSPEEASTARDDQINKAVSHIGKLIVENAAKRKALEVVRDADSSIRATLLQMADMVGADHETGGLRSTMWSNWTARAGQSQLKFLQSPNDKRQIAATYAAAIEGRETTDLSLSALRKALLDLADLHTSVAQGRRTDASETVNLLRQELAFAKHLLETSAPSDAKGGNQ